MPALAESESSVWQVVAFVNSLRHAPASARSVRVREPAVGYARLLRAEDESGDWLTYSGSYRSQRHSRLAEINGDNAGALQLKWVAQMATSATHVKATPLVVGGIVYMTEPPNNVLAVDGRTGKQLWAYRRSLGTAPTLCCGAVNRGLAVLDNVLYMTTVDAHLIALDATSGKLMWDVEVADARDGYSATGVPLAVKDKIITGVAGGEFGIRGFLDAYDAKSGKRVWRFYTIPGPGEPGHETWTADSWRTGGGPTWLTGSFDPELNLVYWGVGNPGPVFQGDVRPGANLYSNSVIALDADTGKLKWHFQFTPHDEHDWDAVQIPVLADAVYDGKMRKLLLWANRNAFYYVLDRETGAFLRARPFSRQTWAEGIGPDGAPIPKKGAEISPQGTLLWPGVLGATNWWSPAYDPRTGLFFLSALDSADVFFKQDSVTYVRGQYFGGSTHQAAPGVTSTHAVKALRGDTGELAWEYRFPTPAKNSMGGILSTAGNLLFVGNDDQFTVLDSTTGKELWTFNPGGEIVAAPVTYLVDGRQQVTVAAGRALFTFGLAQTTRTTDIDRRRAPEVSSGTATAASGATHE
jgi:alcohol dehydrogenase (cytochrome c)